MSALNSSGSPRSISVNGRQATTPNSVINYSIPLKDVEHAITLPADTFRFKIKARNASRLQLTYVAGESSTKFWTIYPGDILEEGEIDRPTTILYVQSAKDAEVVEITTWS